MANTTDPFELKVARMRKGVRQQDIADEWGVRRESIAKFEIGSRPSLPGNHSVDDFLETIERISARKRAEELASTRKQP